MIFGNVDVSLREALDKGWQNGGKMVANWWQTPDLPTLFVFYTTYSCESWRGKTLLRRTKRVSCIMNTMYFAQRTGLHTENKVFETGLAIRGQVFIKAEKRTIT